MKQEIDYRELLKKYMNLVISREGIDFLNDIEGENFTQEEIEELEAISLEPWDTNTTE